MATLNQFLDEYAESHQNPLNIKLHTICVPLITWSLLGVLHTVPLLKGLYLSHIFVGLALLYYLSFKNLKYFFSMLLVSLVMLFSFQFVPHLLYVSIGIFIIGWVGQFYGHKVEGKKPSFFKDVQFLLIGPLWVLKKLFPKLYS